MRMGFLDTAGMTGGALMIGWGMARPRTGDARVEGPLDAALLGGGSVIFAGSLAFKAIQGNEKSGKK